MMRHLTIQVRLIHPNPHRDFKRNPISQDQVDKILESIGRTGFWDNTVVREHPDRPGEYQLAYGHSRLDAVRQAGITEVVLPVADLSDWDMYCAMVDENEIQPQITPIAAFENVEVGVTLLEKAFEAVGPAGTAEEFYKALNNRSQGQEGDVLRGAQRGNDGHGFEQARNAFFRGEGIGRVFVADVLPFGRLHASVISEILNTHYGQQRADAKRKEAQEAEQRRKEAEMRQREAEQKRDEAGRRWNGARVVEAEQREAERRRGEAEKARIEAERFQVEAKKIDEGSIDEKILLQFGTPGQMAAFAQAIRSAGVSKAYHQLAAEYVLKEAISIRDMTQKLNFWWYKTSGQEQQDWERAEREKTEGGLRKRLGGKDSTESLIVLVAKIRTFHKDIQVALSAVPYCTQENLRRNLIQDLNALIVNCQEMVLQLGHTVGANGDAVEVVNQLNQGGSIN